MGVYIKGMEMPTTCSDCPLSTFMDFDSMPFCNVTMDDICFNDWETKRCDHCPLVPVPPHGRLIDADRLKSDGFHTLVCYTGKMPYEYTAMRIDDAPTVIPASGGKEDE